MNQHRNVLLIFIVSTFFSLHVFAQDELDSKLTETCTSVNTDELTDEQLRAMTAETRKIALAFFQSGPEIQDEMLTPDAYIWSLGLGEIDRSKWIELHNPKGGSTKRSKPKSHKQTINFVTAEGDRAAVDMENYVVFDDFTYDQKYHNLVIVREGKVCLLKIFASADMGEKLLPDIKDYTR